METEGLSKSYGRIKALHNFNLTVEPGSVYGILGPNGSGKTTCLSILLDVIKADSGSYQWFEENPSHQTRRRRIGALIETPNFYPYLSAVQNLEIVCAIKGRSRKHINTALHVTDLSKRRNSKYNTYSLGMKQRLAIASTLLANPEVLVFDEPTNGLDPQGIKEIRDLILEVSQQGKTIIIASHLLDEIEKVCTHVAILKSGEILASGKVSQVIGSDNVVEVSAENLEALQEMAKEINDLAGVERKKDMLVLKFHNPVNSGAINKHFFEKGITLTMIHTKKRSLENLFIEITKNAS